ncbi:MAG: lysophospholipase [Bacteroidota bacterium]
MAFSSNGQEFFHQEWPAKQPKAVMLLTHGHGEHIGRYAHVVHFLNERGISVAGFDHYGHGKTQSKKGDIPSYEAVLDSIGAFVDMMQQKWSGLPLFVYAHSLGGNFLASYVLQRKPEDWAGVILSAPLFELAFAPSKVDLTLAAVMKRIYPGFTQSSKLDASAISRDPAEVKKYVEDPLIHSMVSPRLFYGFYEHGQKILSEASNWSLPALIMHGTADRLTKHAASEAFAEKAGDQVRFRSWKGLFHEMHNEPEKKEVMQTMLEWMLPRV